MKNIFILILTALLLNFRAIGSPAPLSPTTVDLAQIRSNLYIVAPDASTTLMDGTLTQYDSGYSNNIDGYDARKITNPSENFGMLRGSTVLIIERRHTIIGNDSIFFKMWNMRIITYQLEFITNNLNKPGRVGVLEDKYLKTATPIDLNGTSHINFSVTADPASMATDRFMIIFSTPGYSPLPLTFISANAFQQNNQVNIDWTTANENNMKQYNVERSADGNHFVQETVLKAINSSYNNYHWVDTYPVQGYNYYRLRSTEVDGKINYSGIMKVFVSKDKQVIQVFPNPATANNLNLQLINQQPGLYEIRLINSFGQTFMTRSIQYSGSSSIENLKPGQSIPKGIYQLEIKTPGGEKKVISVVF